MKKVEQQLNNLLKKLNENFKEFSKEQNNEYQKIGFFYSCDRMSPLEAALRMYFVLTNNIDEIYSKRFQDFVKSIEQ